MNRNVQTLTLVGCGIATALSLLPVASQADARMAEPSGYEQLFYALHAAPLRLTAESVSVQFAYYRDDALLESKEVQVDFGRDEIAIVPIPTSNALLQMQRRDPRTELRIYAGDLLIDRLDYRSLLLHNQTLLHTHAAVLESITGLAQGDVENIDCGDPPPGACNNWGCLPHQDYDCDGVKNSTDNCTDNYNPGQANCDGDLLGNVCDGIDGIFQPSGPVKTCMTDKDDHVVWKSFEHFVEQRLVDVSNCNSPDRWNRWIRDEATCVNESDYECCRILSTSITQVGDSWPLWCGQRRNQNFCH